MTTVIEVKTRKMFGPGWATVALIEDTALMHRFFAYSLITKDYPKASDVGEVKKRGHRLPAHVARMHFPQFSRLRRGALALQNNVAA